MDTPVIKVQGLTKTYGDFQAVKGIDFEIKTGEVFGLPGPNGAGKTTTLGFEPEAQSKQLKDRIGACLQFTNFSAKLKVREATVGQSVIEIHCEEPLPPEVALPRRNGASRVHASDDRKSLTIHSSHPARTLVEIVKWVDSLGKELADVHLKRPSLEDVFIELTGKSLRE